ncbi:MAG: hypothetical protein CM1200mP20_09530 [Pseudomonadota bacterium]|nr:MAG: hypothetical protein CM1200mP20_09530 [Pseudomonadota bacterium]
MVEELILKIDDSGTRIVMVSHDLGQVRRLADEVIFLHKGQLIEISPGDAVSGRRPHGPGPGIHQR